VRGWVRAVRSRRRSEDQSFLSSFLRDLTTTSCHSRKAELGAGALLNRPDGGDGADALRFRELLARWQT